MENQIEIWKDIPGYEDSYQCSNLGNVKSKKFGRNKLLKQGYNHNGYLLVSLYLKGKPKTLQVHQLVAMTFLNHKRCKHELVVNHKNFIKSDNNLSNLEIVTARENSNKKHIKSSSKYVGVCKRKSNNRWFAYITYNKKRITLGTFETEKEASKYYLKALKSIKKGTDIEVARNVYSSKFIGVSWHIKRKKWCANIKINKKTRYLGSFENELDAKKAYESALVLKKHWDNQK